MVHFAGVVVGAELAVEGIFCHVVGKDGEEDESFWIKVRLGIAKNSMVFSHVGRYMYRAVTLTEIHIGFIDFGTCNRYTLLVYFIYTIERRIWGKGNLLLMLKLGRIGFLLPR